MLLVVICCFRDFSLRSLFVIVPNSLHFHIYICDVCSITRFLSHYPGHYTLVVKLHHNYALMLSLSGPSFTTIIHAQSLTPVTCGRPPPSPQHSRAATIEIPGNCCLWRHLRCHHPRHQTFLAITAGFVSRYLRSPRQENFCGGKQARMAVL